MPGAWEMNPSVLCAILHVENTTVAWSFGFKNLVIPGPFMGLTGMPFDHARNAACMKALELGVDYLFFLDSDVVPSSDAILKLLSHKVPLISGIYYRRSPPHGVPVMIRNGQWITQFPVNTVIEVDVVGAGCLLLRRDLLEKMPPQRPQAGRHWFDWRVDMQGLLPQGECLSEDFTMCVHAKKTLGIPTLVDTSVQCRHIGYSQAIYGGMVPLETNPNT